MAGVLCAGPAPRDAFIRDSSFSTSEEEIADSDLILPGADSTLDDIRELLSTSTEGLIPN